MVETVTLDRVCFGVPIVASVGKQDRHSFSKPPTDDLFVVKGFGVQGDAHFGETVKHRSRVAVDPTKPNLRQVHLMPLELFEEVAAKGFTVKAGDLGENITTAGVDLLGLPRGTVLSIGPSAVLEVTGLRNPCRQIDDFQTGLLRAVLEQGPDGRMIRKAGIMSIVLADGLIRSGDAINIALPRPPHEKLERV